MSKIENLFLFEEENKFEAPDQPIELNFNRTKLGEVYKIQNDQYSLVCVHCSAEFQYFSEFTLHVEEHLRKLASKLADSCVDSRLVEIKIETEEEVDAVPTTSLTEQQSKNSSSELVVEHIASTKIESGSEDDSKSFENDISFNCSDDEKQESVRGTDESVDFKTQNAVSKQNTKKIAKKRSKAIKPMKPKKTPSLKKAGVKQLLLEKSLKTKKKAYGEVFKRFKAELSCRLYPMKLIDTPESRLLINYAESERINRTMACPLCKKSLKVMAALQSHIFTHATKKYFQCDLCAKAYRVPRYLHSHLRDDHKAEHDAKSYECCLCHTSFEIHGLLVRHMDCHLSENLECIICNRKFDTFQIYESHMNVMHPIGGKTDAQHLILNESIKKMIAVEPIQYSTQKPVITSFECYLCRHNFRERRQLRVHLRLHTQRPRLCPICGCCTTTMFRHMKLHENNDGNTKPHKCTLCGKAFSVRRYLLRHNRKEHNLYADNQPPVCKICGNLFANKRILHIHMREHPFEEKRNFVCEICQHAAKNAYGLRRHMLTHNKDKSFECDICHKHFSAHYALQHMKSHTTLKKHKCKICDKRFKQASLLKRHMITHGFKMQLVCNICGKLFSRPDTLARHRRQTGHKK